MKMGVIGLGYIGVTRGIEAPNLVRL